MKILRTIKLSLNLLIIILPKIGERLARTFPDNNNEYKKYLGLQANQSFYSIE